MLHDRNPAYDPLSSASMFSRFKMVDKLLLEAIENLSDRKIRPNFENIAKFMNCHFSTAEAEVFDELNFLLRKVRHLGGIVDSVNSFVMYRVFLELETKSSLFVRQSPSFKGGQ